MNGNWGSFLQGGQDWQKIDVMGKELSLKLQESVHYPAYNDRKFECECGVIFGVWIVEGAIITGNWQAIFKLHKEQKSIAQYTESLKWTKCE